MVSWNPETNRFEGSYFDPDETEWISFSEAPQTQGHITSDPNATVESNDLEEAARQSVISQLRAYAEKQLMKKHPADGAWWDYYSEAFGYVNPHTGEMGAAKSAAQGGLIRMQQGGIADMAPEAVRMGVEQAVGVPQAPPEDVVLETVMGETAVPGGGIAAVETEFVSEGKAPPVDIQDPLVEQAVQAVLGRVDQPDAIINAFVEKYGVEAFRQLRNDVLRMVEPNAQTEGMIAGEGGGMDDQVMGMIGDQQRVAVSPGEYIVPADVVSGIGDGSSESGAEELDQMMDEVRMARHGGTIQPQPYEGALPR